MNIYDYFISKSIADYCQSIGHEFDPLEMAVIVAISDKTILEKHAAWREIIAGYTDMPIPTHNNTGFAARESLHEYLQGYISWEKKLQKTFRASSDNAIYVPSVTWSSSSRLILGYYSNFKNAQSKIKDYVRSMKKKYRNDVMSIEMHKEYIDNSECEPYCANFNMNGEITKLYNEKEYRMPDGGDNSIPHNLDRVYIHIPMPFQKGDIVAFRSRPLVLDTLPQWSDDYDEWLLGDSCCIASTAYCMEDDGMLKRLVIEEPHEFEFWTEEVKAPHLFAVELSRYLRGDTDNLAMLFNMFHKIKMEVDVTTANGLLGMI